MGAHVRVGVSVGASLFPLDAADAATLLQHTDAAMYRAKACEGSCWVLYGGPVESGPP